MQGPLIRKSGTDEVVLSWQATNEIFFHWGANIDKTNFDQNRTLAGVVIPVSKKIDFAVLYQLIIQHQVLLQTNQVINSVRLNVFHNLDFRKR
jgi:hypothetical protein